MPIPPRAAGARLQCYSERINDQGWIWRLWVSATYGSKPDVEPWKKKLADFHDNDEKSRDKACRDWMHAVAKAAREEEKK